MFMFGLFSDILMENYHNRADQIGSWSRGICNGGTLRNCYYNCDLELSYDNDALMMCIDNCTQSCPKRLEIGKLTIRTKCNG